MEIYSLQELSNVWQELLVTGLVPILALVFCNLRIYCKIRESSQHETHRSGKNFNPSQEREIAKPKAASYPEKKSLF